MTVAIESVLFLLAGIALAIVVTRVLSRGMEPPPATGAAAVQLVRTARTADGREETRLTVNDQVIVAASNDGVRLAEYADEVEFVRLSAGAEMAEGIAMRTLPRTTDEEAEDRSSRRPRHTNTGAS